MRYDGAWDFYSLVDAFEQPASERIRRSAHAFANLPASGGLVLLLAAALALICANTPLAGFYHAFINSSFGIGPADTPLSLTVGDWFSEGLLALFFLLVGLEIRREMTAGALSDVKAALLPAIAGDRWRHHAGAHLSGVQSRRHGARLVGADGDRHRLCARHHGAVRRSRRRSCASSSAAFAVIDDVLSF